ncbi:MAG: deoxyribodipyrimidine photo-lyase, partial [Cyanobacteriota bacterium]|nr:deoxyribodipyrimidine photo-lyase [Cyanobacteriota bacterium]
MSQDMEREFASRDELIAYVREQFPEAAARDSSVPPILGGRKAAETALQQVEPGKYALTRNFLNGAITRLSPYLRYGVLSLAEVRDAVL